VSEGVEEEEEEEGEEEVRGRRPVLIAVVSE
jgi:hypothetical protein